jgi:hypothetical protein
VAISYRSVFVVELFTGAISPFSKANYTLTLSAVHRREVADQSDYPAEPLRPADESPQVKKNSRHCFLTDAEVNA